MRGRNLFDVIDGVAARPIATVLALAKDERRKLDKLLRGNGCNDRNRWIAKDERRKLDKLLCDHQRDCQSSSTCDSTCDSTCHSTCHSKCNGSTKFLRARGGQPKQPQSMEQSVSQLRCLRGELLRPFCEKLGGWRRNRLRQ